MQKGQAISGRQPQGSRRRGMTMRFAVAYILFAGTKIVEAPDEAAAKEIVENMTNDELMNDAEDHDIVQSVTPAD